MRTKEATEERCLYCGHETADQTGIHSELYKLLSKFAQEHASNRTWEHCHEYAAKIEALFRDGDAPA